MSQQIQLSVSLEWLEKKSQDLQLRPHLECTIRKKRLNYVPNSILVLSLLLFWVYECINSDNSVFEKCSGGAQAGLAVYDLSEKEDNKKNWVHFVKAAKEFCHHRFQWEQNGRNTSGHLFSHYTVYIVYYVLLYSQKSAIWITAPCLMKLIIHFLIFLWSDIKNRWGLFYVLICKNLFHVTFSLMHLLLTNLHNKISVIINQHAALERLNFPFLFPPRMSHLSCHR